MSASAIAPHAIRSRAVGLAEADAIALGVVDHAGLGDVGRKVGERSDHAPRLDGRGDDAARIDALEPQPFELAAVALEIPPRDAVLRADDDRVGPNSGRSDGASAVRAVRLDAEEHDVGGADRRQIAGDLRRTSKSPSGLVTRRPRSCIARRCGPRANSTTSAPPRRRAPMYPPIAPGAGDDDLHGAASREGLRHDAALNLAGGRARNRRR